jgi:hypothetical protein
MTRNSMAIILAVAAGGTVLQMTGMSLPERDGAGGG